MTNIEGYSNVKYESLDKINQYFNNIIRFETSKSRLSVAEKAEVKDSVESYYFYVIMNDILLFDVFTPDDSVNKQSISRVLNFAKFVHGLYPSTFRASRYNLRSFAEVCILDNGDIPFQDMLRRRITPIGYFNAIYSNNRDRLFYVTRIENFKTSCWLSSCHRKCGLSKETFNDVVEKIAISNLGREGYIDYIKKNRKPYLIPSYKDFVRLYTEVFGSLNYNTRYTSCNVYELR